MTDLLTTDWRAYASRACGRDITANRHRGNPESEDAFRRVGMHLTEGRAAVLEAIRSAKDGLTCRELAVRWDVGMNTVSGRLSELKRAGLIRPTGEKRDGCAVMISV